jgi:hypothetical protein
MIARKRYHKSMKHPQKISRVSPPEPDETNEEAVIMRRVVRYLLAYSQALARKKAARESDNECV